ncbi:MAG: glycosyltransferase family 39 protein [Clostridiaceae bacterium]|nr:glycosyltransferase family 39 protein [Clostridiaceae bacterium]
MFTIVLIALVSSCLLYFVLGFVPEHVMTGPAASSVRKRTSNRGRGGRKGKHSVSTVVNGMSDEDERKVGLSFLAVFMVAAFLIRIAGALLYKGYEADLNCFISWSDMVYEYGFGEFYKLDAFTDYPPGYMYILYLLGGLRSMLGLGSDSLITVLLTKLPAILADMATGYLVFKIANKRMKTTGAAFIAGIFLITPSIFLDSAIWAQVDSVFTLCIVLMCYLITEKKLIPAYFIFAAGILIKPQSLIFTPVLIYGIIDQIFIEAYQSSGKGFYKEKAFQKVFFQNLFLGLLAIALIALFMMPFGFTEALSQYTETVGSYPSASVNAYNLWTMLGQNWVSQTEVFMGLTFQTWGTLFIIVTVVFSAVINFKTKDTQSKYYFIAALIVSGVFVLSVRMHERYIYPAVVLLLLAYAARPRKKLFYAYLLIAAGSFCNMAYSMLYYDASNFDRYELFPRVVGFFMLCVLAYLVWLSVSCYLGYHSEALEDKLIQDDNALPFWRRKMKSRDESVIRPTRKLGKIVKADLIAMGVITVLYACVAFYNLGNMEAPETDYSFVNQGEVVLDFGQEVQISKIWDYLGYQHNVKYIIAVTNDLESGEWAEIYSDASPWEPGSVFCWNSTETTIQGRYVRIEANSETTTDSMIELIFQDAEGNSLVPVNTDDYPTLFDEQDLFEGRASWSNGTYFDEIYHARSAYEMIHGLYTYENTHPPLGKIFIAVGILIFGMNPFGWRFMGTLFGVLMLPILYLFAKKLFQETWISIVTTLLFALDFMHFTQTRIATIDVFVTLFIILAYYFMFCYTRKSFYDTRLRDTFFALGACGIAMGLSWACKWTGIYATAGLCLLFFVTMGQRFREYIYAVKHRGGTSYGISHNYIAQNFHQLFFKTIGFCCIFFVVIPATIYTLSYIPFNDLTDHGVVRRMLDNQTSMYNYHSNLESTHPYSSTWYEWPIMKRPIWYFSGEITSNLREGISAFGNPAVWWMGIPVFLIILYLALRKKEKGAGFLAVGYLSQYLPWVFIGRVVFIYHYFPSVPFVVMMIGYCMKKLVDWKPKLKPAMYVYVGIALVLFVMFYPVISGKAVDPEYVQKWLKWFDDWVLIQTW